MYVFSIIKQHISKNLIQHTPKRHLEAQYKNNKIEKVDTKGPQQSPWNPKRSPGTFKKVPTGSQCHPKRFTKKPERSQGAFRSPPSRFTGGVLEKWRKTVVFCVHAKTCLNTYQYSHVFSNTSVFIRLFTMRILKVCLALSLFSWGYLWFVWISFPST